MKKQFYVCIFICAMSIISCKKKEIVPVTPGTDSVPVRVKIPSPPFKVAYYAFDATPNLLPLTNFATGANVVVLFEGTAWEMADSAHYGKSDSYILTVNPNYHSYKSIIDHVRILQKSGVKVLMNVDDANSWNTTTPFTDYKGQALDYQQFATFIKNCITDSLHLDGIALDVEHMLNTPANSNFISLVKELGKYYGPLSPDSNYTIYTAAIFTGGRAGYAIGQSRDVAQYFNFVQDMGYFQNNVTRFNRWSDSIGAAKTMIGVAKVYNTLENAKTAASWHPAVGTKAGIMVFAGNVDSAYTNTTFRSLK
ncbi:hypothetical protein SAMN05518672_103704 [Chitinophaga sp. CF118]|uniref:EndoS/ChiA family endoglycosidase n=1 Tax=Chitinophaga sp. CF118 TaxID=1884367 RepID=UPI0008E7B36B|nr:glycosyl hydrolase family 18 protein [Chitinophaga sp. CF118]SFD88715.1 hypothetical protein SAMN05518672_103704 [Chitinophaga sp. CF118]